MMMAGVGVEDFDILPARGGGAQSFIGLADGNLAEIYRDHVRNVPGAGSVVERGCPGKSRFSETSSEAMATRSSSSNMTIGLAASRSLAKPMPSLVETRKENTPSRSSTDCSSACFERLALRQLVGEINGDQFAVIVGAELEAARFKPAAHLPVIGDLAVMHDGDIGEAGRPEGMRGFGLDVGFGGQPDMADAMRTGDVADVVDPVEITRRADILDDVERRADGDQLGGMLHRIGEGTDFAGIIDFDHETRAFALFARRIAASAPPAPARMRRDGRLGVSSTMKRSRKPWTPSS